MVLLALVGIGVASGSGAGPQQSLVLRNGLSKIRHRNNQLRSEISLLQEQRLHAGPPASSTPVHLNHPPQQAEPESSTESSVAETESSCDPNYEGACLNAGVPDYDCAGGDGNGPDYTGEVTVVGEDHFGLDADGDGIGCEAN